VAKRESMDSSKDSGGDLGWFTPDRMVKPFSDAVVALKPGEYTHTPVQTQYGWHIIKLEETRDLAPPSFDQVKQRLDQVIQAKKFKSYVDGLMKTAKVEKKLEAAPAAAAASGSSGSAAAPAAPTDKPAEQK
jgi:peptidyl-prolyl cis-trans isomerase C